MGVEEMETIGVLGGKDMVEKARCYASIKHTHMTQYIFELSH